MTIDYLRRIRTLPQDLFSFIADWSQEIFNIIFQQPRNVLLNGAKGDGVTDDTAAIQDLLDKGDIFLPYTDSFYSLSSALKIPSNRTIKCSRFAHIKRADNTWATAQAGLAENEDQVNGNVNIFIEGGIWDGNRSGNSRIDTPFSPQTVFRFKKASFLTVRDLTIKEPVMFSFLAGDTTDINVSKVVLDQSIRIPNGDGIHLTGPLRNFTIRDISGNTGDDLVSLCCSDAPGSTWLWSQGIIEDGLVENLFAPLGNSCLRLLSGDGYTLRRVVARNLRGTFDGSGILIGPFNLPDSNFEDILIDGVNIIRSNETQSTQYPVIQIDGSTKNIRLCNFIRSSEDVTNWPLLTLVTGKTYGDISLCGAKDESSIDRDIVHVREEVNSLNISDLTVVQTAGTNTGQVIRTIKTGGVKNSKINFSNIVLRGMSGLGQTATDDELIVNITGLQQSDGYFVWRANGKTDLRATNVNASLALGPLSAFSIVPDSSGPIFYQISNSKIIAPYGLSDVYASGPYSHRIISSNCDVTRTIDSNKWGVNINTADSGVILSVSSTDFPIEKNKLTPLNGDKARDVDGWTWTRVLGGWKPDSDSSIITSLSPTTGNTLTANSLMLNEQFYVTPSGTLANLSISLPTVANSRIGQQIDVFISQIISSLSVSVAGSGTVVGGSPITSNVNSTFGYKCVSLSGNGTWLLYSK